VKILIVNDYLERGGAEVYVHNLKSLLESKQYQVRTFTDNSQVIFKSLLSRWFSLKYFFKAKKLIEKFKPDIVHINSISRNISPSPILAAKKLGVPVVMTVHDFHSVCPKTWMIYKNKKPCHYGFGWRCLISDCYTQKMGMRNFPYHWIKWLKVCLHRIILRKYVGHFICPSRTLAQWMKKSLRLNNISYVPNFVNVVVNDIHREVLPRENQFLFVGRLSHEKGADILIKAIKLVKEKSPDVKVKIIGDGPEKQNLEKQAKNMGLENSLLFLGKTSNENLPQYYRESLAIIIPSIWMENNPIVAFEAMNMGRLIIASNRGGLPDLVKDGYNGFLFEAGDYKTLTEKMLQLLQNSNLAQQMGKNSKTMMQECFSPNIHYRKIIDIYEKVR